MTAVGVFSCCADGGAIVDERETDALLVLVLSLSLLKSRRVFFVL